MYVLNKVWSQGCHIGLIVPQMEKSETQKVPENKKDELRVYTWNNPCTQPNMNQRHLTNTDPDFHLISSGSADRNIVQVRRPW